jgi:hypothetical protein
LQSEDESVTQRHPWGPTLFSTRMNPILGQKENYDEAS